MKIVISCCDKKNGDLFHHNGEAINFVSHANEFAPIDQLNFHPDDLVPNENFTWRELVAQQENRDDLLSSYILYKPNIYNVLYQHYGNDLFIFSAGWGIVRADYKLPKYNITFSTKNNIPPYAKRNNNFFDDFNQLEEIDENERILFIAGKDYVFPFCELTEHLPNEKIIIYKSHDVLNNNQYLNNNNFIFRQYQTNTRTNWHYEYAKRLITNEVEL